MLLRRITKHVKEQNWFAVGVDFVIVVIGVFIGIQVANWNDARQEAARRELVHQRLLSDFDLIEQQSETAVNHIDRVMSSLIILQEAVMSGSFEEDEEDSIKYALEYGFSYPTFNQRSGTYVELLSSGRLDLIKDANTRLALSAYDQTVQQSRFNETQINEYATDNFSLIVFGRYRELAPPHRNEGGEFERGAVISFDIAAMAADEEFIHQLDRMIENRAWLAGNVYGSRRAVQRVVSELGGE